MILTIACSACSTSFPVDPRKVPDEGVYARCSACEEVFFVDAAMPAASPTPPVALEESPWLTESISPTGAEEAPPEEQPDSVEEVVKNVEASPWFSEPSSPLGGAASPPVEAPAPEPVTEVPPPPPPPSPAPPPTPSPAPPPPQPAVPAGGITFGRRDPHEKASRLARVLVSDMIAYNPERHQQALDGGTLKEDFEDEIQKSLAEYVEQVGRELADSTDYFEKALNEILAGGQQIF